MDKTDLRSAINNAFPKVRVNTNQDDDDLNQNQNQNLNQKELLDVMGEVIGNAINANSQLILNQVGELMKKSDASIQQTQKALVGVMSHISVSETRNKHDDFGDYQEDITNILSKVQGMTPEDAYILAKGRRSQTVPGRDQIETERPDSLAMRSDDYEGREYQEDRDTRADQNDRDRNLPRNPRKEFRSAISAAVDRVTANRRR